MGANGGPSATEDEGGNWALVQVSAHQRTLSLQLSRVEAAGNSLIHERGPLSLPRAVSNNESKPCALAFSDTIIDIVHMHGQHVLVLVQ